MYTSQKEFNERSLNQFNTLKGTGPQMSATPKMSTIIRGSQLLNSITSESENARKSPDFEPKEQDQNKNGGGMIANGSSGSLLIPAEYLTSQQQLDNFETQQQIGNTNIEVT